MEESAGKSSSTTSKGASSRHVLCRETFETREMVAKRPPVWGNKNKKLLYSLCCPEGADSHSGSITYTRCSGFLFPSNYKNDANTFHKMREDVFGYEPTPGIDDEGRAVFVWYLNFAHSHLFVAYSGSLFAQDEMQVCEHPALGSLRDTLQGFAAEHRRYIPLTVESGKPTPILIRGAERRCSVATDANAQQGRPYGLYGNRFSGATEEAIRQATTVLSPPTITNLIAIEAPSGGYGVYSRRDIENVLTTAYSGFYAARLESEFAAGSYMKCYVEIHTGNWGTGAYGGNKTLMALLQILAARLAGVDSLVYHTFQREFSEAYQAALELLDNTLLKDLGSEEEPLKVAKLLDKIEAMGFRWGESDGN